MFIRTFEVEIENILFILIFLEILSLLYITKPESGSCDHHCVLTQCCAGQPHDLLQPPPGGQAGAAHPDLAPSHLHQAHITATDPRLSSPSYSEIVQV